MSSNKTFVVWSCAHTDPGTSNERFDWLGSFLYDLKPDVVIDLGDGADMRSLNSYDTRYPQALVTQSYEEDIEVYNDSQDRLRHKFRHNRRKKPFWVGFEGNHECFQGHTEILVKDKGWVKSPEVQEGDLVFSLGGQWTPVEQAHKYWYEGPMYGFESQTGVFSVTPSHRVYYYGSSGKLFVKKASDSPMSLDLPVATRNKELKLTGLSDSELKFNAIALTDSYHKGSKVVFYQSGSKAEEVEKVIQDCGIGYRKVERNRSPEEICGVKLKTTQVAYEFHMERPEWCVTQNKTIPKEFFYLTEDQFEIFLDMLIFCDGSPMDDRASSVFYGKKQICDDVQSLCQMNGFRASITEYRTGQYRVNINPRNKQRFKKVLQDEVKDWVYCITVPEGNFLARQGGVSLFTGNCRIKTAIKHDPRIEGKTHGISFSHLQTDTWFNEYHEYENSAPAIATYGGVDFAHYFSSGNFGSATSGVHHAYSVINNRHRSSVCGHSHKRDVYFKDAPGSLGMVVGCFKGKEESWAGQANLDWWKGIVVMHDVGEGRFEPQFVSMKMLKEEYGE